jgi:fibronectin-binding autotransporter adhesin
LILNSATLQNTASFTTNRAITLDGEGGAFQTYGDLTVAGVISGSFLLKSGTRVLVLSGQNTYQNDTAIWGGVLSVSSDGNLGDSGNSIGIYWGTLQNTGSFATSRSVTLGNGTFQTDADLTVNGAIEGNTEGGTLNKQGMGTLILTANNTYSGGTTITAGTLQVGNGGTTGSLGTGAVTNNAALVPAQRRDA